MPITKANNSKNATASILYGRDSKYYGEDKCLYKIGFRCNPNTAENDFHRIRVIHNKHTGNQAKLFTQSFPPGTDPDLVNLIGYETVKKFLNENFEDKYQAAIYTHTNTNHPHNHIIINSVGIETGLKFHLYKDAKIFREVSDEVSKRYDIDIVEKEKDIKESLPEIKRRERGQYVWKDDLRERIERSKVDCVSMEEFEKNLKSEGVTVYRFTKKDADGNRKEREYYNYKFEGKDGKSHQSQDRNLADSFRKENLKIEFSANRQRLEIQKTKAPSIRKEEEKPKLEQQKRPPLSSPASRSVKENTPAPIVSSKKSAANLPTDKNELIHLINHLNPTAFSFGGEGAIRKVQDDMSVQTLQQIYLDLVQYVETCQLRAMAIQEIVAPSFYNNPSNYFDIKKWAKRCEELKEEADNEDELMTLDDSKEFYGHSKEPFLQVIEQLEQEIKSGNFKIPPHPITQMTHEQYLNPEDGEISRGMKL